MAKRPEKFYTWASQNNYAMALICWSNSFMNASKFPALFHKYGNIQILLPYLIVTLFLVMPLIYTELALGQYSNCGFVNIWRMTPLAKGLAWSTAAITFFVANYAFFTTTHAGYYFIKAFETSLPWAKCDPVWARENCYNAIEPCLPINLTSQNSVEHFHKEYVLSESALSYGEMNLRLFFFFFATMGIVAFSLIDRTRSIEKFLNFLTLMPFLLLVVLTISSLLNCSDLSSLREFVQPDFKLLLDYQMWTDVTDNAITNIGIGMGGLICISAHGNFRSNIYSLAVFTPLFNLLCDLLFTLFVYSNLLEQSTLKNLPFHELFNEDTSLFFVKIPAVLLEWPSHQQLWTISYFLYLYIIGLRYTIFMIFTLTLGLHEMLHCIFYLRKFAMGVIFCMITFIMPIYISPIGNSLYQQMEAFCSAPFITFIVAIEAACIYYVYNAKTLMIDGHFMLNKRFRYFEYYLYVVPIVLIIITIVNFYNWTHTPRDYRVHWIFIMQIVILSLMIMFLLTHYFVYVVMNWDKKWVSMLQPSETWGCSNVEMRRNREFFKSETADARFTYRQELYERTVAAMN